MMRFIYFRLSLRKSDGISTGKIQQVELNGVQKPTSTKED
jgi:hypothetical protein